MRALESFLSVSLYRDPVDMRKGIYGLLEIVQAAGMGDFKGNHLFIFSGKRRDVVKMVYFDRSGFCMWIKRLEEDRFKWPRVHEDNVVILTPQQLQFLLDGYDIRKMKPFEQISFDRIF